MKTLIDELEQFDEETNRRVHTLTMSPSTFCRLTFGLPIMASRGGITEIYNCRVVLCVDMEEDRVIMAAGKIEKEIRLTTYE